MPRRRAAVAPATMTPAAKDSAPAPDDAAAPEETSSRLILESGQRLSRSRIWDLQRRYFERDGIGAWRDGVVPHYITSNPMIARAYARIVHGYLRDLVAAGQIAADQPLHIVELGSGSGRFAFQFLRIFGALMARSPLSRQPFTYVMTDVSERTIGYWREHPRLAELVAQGRLDFARFDAEQDRGLHLIERGTRLDAGDPAGPLVVIANYVFDGIRTDAFMVAEGKLQEALVTLSAEAGEIGPDDPAILGTLDLSFEGHDVGPGYYGDPEFDRIVEGYGRRLSDTTVLFPVSALDCIRNLAAVAGGRLLLLSGDKGWSGERDLDKTPPPGLVMHGSFSLSVNYHAVAEFFRGRNGIALEPDHAHASLHVGAYMLGAGERDAVETRLAFFESVESGGPDDDFALLRTIGDKPDPDLDETLALLRLSGWDHQIFLRRQEAVRNLAETATKRQKMEIRRALVEVWNNYLFLGETNDLAFQIGVVLMGFDLYADGLAFMRHSLELYGPDPSTLTNAALCLLRLGRFEEAMAAVDEALLLNSAQGTARALRLVIEEERRYFGQPA